MLPNGWLGTGFLENHSITAEVAPTTGRQLVNDLPFAMKFEGAGDSYGSPRPQWLVPTRHVFPLISAIQAKDPSKNMINGTDANPLRLRYHLNHYTNDDCDWCGGDIGNSIWYAELTLNDDRAPTDYVWRVCNPGSESFAAYPIVCQQRLRDSIPGCPPLSTQVRASIAVGLLATLDTNPCDVENGRQPTNYHLNVFDGLKWWDLRQNLFPGGGTGQKPGNFPVREGLPAWLYMEVRSNEIYLTWDVWWEFDPNHPGLEIEHSYATVPRMYTGPFNKLASGPGPACELNSGTYTCKGPHDVYKYCSGSDLNRNGSIKKPDWCWRNTFVDSLVLYDGVLVSNDGACCLPNGTCMVTNPDVCTANNGSFYGTGTVCESVVCCPIPFADAEGDGDVDQEDFGLFQICYTGQAGGVPNGCDCFDRDDDGHITLDDFIAFGRCFTGANVPWSQGLTPNCEP